MLSIPLTTLIDIENHGLRSFLNISSVLLTIVIDDTLCEQSYGPSGPLSRALISLILAQVSKKSIYSRS